MTKELKIKISNSNKGQKRSEQAKQNMSLAFKGRIVSMEVRKKLSEYNKCIGRIPPSNKGKSHSQETKDKIAQSHSGEKSHFYKDGRSKDKEYLKEMRKIITHKRNAWKNGQNGSYTINEWEKLKRKYKYSCPACGRSEPQIKLTVDHIIPLSRGGCNTIDNIQPLCSICNCRKATMVRAFEPSGQLKIV